MTTLLNQKEIGQATIPSLGEAEVREGGEGTSFQTDAADGPDFGGVESAPPLLQPATIHPIAGTTSAETATRTKDNQHEKQAVTNNDAARAEMKDQEPPLCGNPVNSSVLAKAAISSSAIFL